MQNKIQIDGNDFSDCIDGINNFELSFGFNATNQTVTYATSNKLTATGDAYEYIRTKFLSDCTASFDVLVYECRCKETYTFIIEARNIELCLNDCGATFSLTTYNSDVQSYDCLNRQIWLSDDFLNSQTHLKFYQGNFQVIVSGTQVETSPEGWWSGYLVREVLEFHAQRCGLEFQSSIFQDATKDYYNLVVLPEGVISESGDLQNNVNLGQNTTDTVIEFLDKLKKVFNAEYEIRNGVLYFEQKDNLPSATPSQIIDLDTVLTEDSICIELIQDGSANCGYGRYEWAVDDEDYATKRRAYQLYYKNLIDYNPDGANPSLSGQCGDVFDFAVMDSVLNNSANVFSYTGTLGIDRMLIWNGESSRNDARVKQDECYEADSTLGTGLTGTIGIGNAPESNCALHVTEQNASNNILQFWASDAPNSGTCKYQLSDFCFMPSDFCDAVQKIFAAGAGVGLKTSIGTFTPDRQNGQIKIVFSKRLICIEALFV